jgi:hypothetical protein
VVGEAAAGLVAVFDGREQRAQEQHEAVGVLVRGQGLGHQLGRVAADAGHGVDAAQLEAVGAAHAQVHGLARTWSRPKPASNRRMKGPIAQEALLSLALPSSSALRPSMSRRLTSLPRLAPTMSPRLLTASTSSGSGLFQAESARMPMSAPGPPRPAPGPW